MGNRSRLLRSETAAYIAGIVDGEGTVTLGRLHAAENRRLVVSIANTELLLLKFILAAVQAGKITRKRTRAAHHTPSFCYSITGSQALALLAQIEPYLRTYKRLRSRMALDEYRLLTPRNGKYTRKLKAARDDFEERFLSTRAGGALIHADRLSAAR